MTMTTADAKRAEYRYRRALNLCVRGGCHAEAATHTFATGEQRRLAYCEDHRSDSRERSRRYYYKPGNHKVQAKRMMDRRAAGLAP